MVLLIYHCFGLLALRISRNGRWTPLEPDPPEVSPVAPEEPYRGEAPHAKGVWSGADQGGYFGKATGARVSCQQMGQTIL